MEMIAKILKLTEFFKDDAGALSSMRLMTIGTLVAVLAPWIWTWLSTGQYTPLSAADAAVVAAALAGKAAQGWAEYGGGASK